LNYAIWFTFFFPDLTHLSRLDAVSILAGFYTYLISLVSIKCRQFALYLMLLCRGAVDSRLIWKLHELLSWLTYCQFSHDIGIIIL